MVRKTGRCAPAWVRCVAGWRFWVWIKLGNLAGSRRKKMGVSVESKSVSVWKRIGEG